MKYLLDTNICIYILKKKPLEVFNKLNSHNLNDIGISVITYSELVYGCEKSQKIEENKLLLNEFLNHLTIYKWNEDAADHYAEIRVNLEKKGMIIGNMDLLIASHARSMGMTLVTNNEKEFKRVPRLLIENWAKN